MKHFDNITYEIYSKTVNKQEVEKANRNIDCQFKNALKGLITECINFTKIIQNEKDIKEINYGDYLRFEMEL